MRTDDICEHYADKKVGLALRLLEEDDGEAPSIVLIEGSSDALRMLAELLIAVAEETDNDGFSISPTGAGRIHFSPSSKFGVYIHRK